MARSQPGAEDAGGPAVSLERYEQRLDEALRALDGPGNEADRLAAARRALEAPDGVRLRSGDVVVPESLLAADGSRAGAPAAATAGDEAIADARRRLTWLRDQLTASRGDDTAARQARLAEILAGPEFQARRSLWQRLLDWLASLLLDRATDDLPTGLARLMSLVLGPLGAAVILLLLGYWLRRLWANLVREAELAPVVAPEGDLPATAEEAQRQAARLAAAGNHREAVRRLCLAALLLLEERGLLRRDRSLTNRELLDQLAAAPTLQQRLRPVVETFDAVWYGVREPDQATFRAYQDDVARLAAVARVPERPPAPPTGAGAKVAE